MPKNNKTVVYTAKLKDDTKKGAKSVENSMKSMAKTIGPLVAVGFGVAAIKSATDAYIRQENAIRQLEQRLKSTGGAVGFTSKELQGMAASLQKVTTFGDEATIEMQSLLLTFTQIKGDTFVGAQEAILNVATAMGTDLKSAAIQVGKALNDPKGQLSALSRSGIQFNEVQKEQIKLMQEAGDVAGAQAVILKELEVQFGGAAKAARDTLGGSIQSLSNSLGDLGEILIGKGTEATGIVGGINAATSALTTFNEELAKVDINVLSLLTPGATVGDLLAQRALGGGPNQAGQRFGITGQTDGEDVETEFTPAAMAALNQQRIDSELALTQSLQDVFMGRADAEIRAAEYVAEREKQINEARRNATGNFFSDLRSLSEGAGETGFKIAQTAAISETAINTSKAAMGAYSALAGIPIIGPALGVAASAAAIAAGAAQINQIKSQSYGGGGGTSAISGTGGGTASSPVVTQPSQTTQAPANSLTVSILGNVIGEDRYVEESLIPALQAAFDRNVPMQFVEATA